MTRRGVEPRSPGPFANSLTIMPMIYICVRVCVCVCVREARWICTVVTNKNLWKTRLEELFVIHHERGYPATLIKMIRIKNSIKRTTTPPQKKTLVRACANWTKLHARTHGRIHTSNHFANGPGDVGSILGRVIPKTFKMVLDTSLLNTHQYKVRIKSKVEQSRERSSALPYTSV